MPNINLITIINILISKEGEEWERKSNTSAAIRETQQCLEAAVQRYEVFLHFMKSKVQKYFYS